jgi:hypothetical protein
MTSSKLFPLLVLCAAAQLKAAFPDDGMVAYYQFQGSLSNSVGGGFEGQGFGPLSYATNRFGVANSALAFQSGAYMTVNPTPFGVNTNYTVSLWIYGDPAASDPVQQFMATGFDIQGGLTLRYDNVNGYGFSSGRYDGDPTPAGLAGGVGTPFKSQWNQLVLTRTNSTTALYLNGQLLGALEPTPSTTDSGTLQFGWHQEILNSYNFQGSMDDIRIYDRSFTSSEVSELYTIESVPEPSTYALLALGAICVIWFRLRQRKA